jgi:hypothetical protein
MTANAEGTTPADSTDSDNHERSAPTPVLDEGEDGRTLVHAKPYQIPGTLQRLYWHEGLSQSEIAEKFDIHQSTVSKWMRKHEIDTCADAIKRNDDGNLSYSERSDGRTQIDVLGTDGDMISFCESQLVALAKFSISDVFDDDTHVHHRLGSGAHLNLPENLDVVEASEHTRRHAEGTATDPPEAVLEELVEGGD